jgi:hypothetical protein
MSMGFRLEVVPIPVADVGWAKRFYGEQVGLNVDLGTGTWTTVSGLRGEAEIGTPSASSAIRTAKAGSYRSVVLVTRPSKGE